MLKLLVLVCLVAIVAYINRLSELAGSIGKSVKLFKKALHEDETPPTRDVAELEDPNKKS